jgi:hypothetical protein
MLYEPHIIWFEQADIYQSLPVNLYNKSAKLESLRMNGVMTILTAATGGQITVVATSQSFLGVHSFGSSAHSATIVTDALNRRAIDAPHV